MTAGRAAFHTLGCKVNSYETQAILEQFEALGFEVVPYDQPADVYVVNTCSVTGEAARKSRQILNRAKKRSPGAITVATGCYAQEDAGKLAGMADLVIGNNEKSRIAQIVKEKIEENRIREAQRGCRPAGAVLVDDLAKPVAYEEQQISNQGSHVRAYVKIQDGCNRFCSYCIIPYLRGRSRSRAEKDILAEVRRLADSGYKEIVLTGIDISDFRIAKACVEGNVKNSVCPPEESLSVLLEKIDAMDGIERIRLGSLEEGILTASFVQALARIRKLCPQFHLSLQSGSDSVLKRMNRHYTTEEFAATAELLRAWFDDPAITTDIITGFPGETEEEFAQTLDFVKQIRFSSVHVFKYSRREGTVADRMKDQHTDRTKTERSERLIAAAQILKQDYRNRFVGKSRPVLFEERITIDGETCLTGFTPEYIKIKIKDDTGRINQIREVTLTPDLFLD